MAKKNNQKRKLSPVEKTINVVLVLIVVLVLALAGFATGPKVWSGLKGMLPQPPQPDTSVVSGMAESHNMTVEEFKAEYNLAEDVTGETEVTDIVSDMTLKNYAKLSKKEYAEFVEEMGIKDKVTEETTWGVAESLIPSGNYLGGEEIFNQFKEYYQLDDSITMQTPWGELKAILEAKQEEMSAQAQTQNEAEAQ